MSLRRSIFHGSVVLGVGECAVYGLSFVRNIILARLLSRADLGVAATFSMVLTVFELASKMAMGRFLVQDKEGAALPFMATAHALQFAAGLCSTLLVVVAAAPLAHVFRLQGDVRTFQYLALLPLFQGLTHLDVCRMERDFRYVPSTLSNVLPQAIMTAVAWPLARWLADYRAVLILLVLKGIIALLATHLLAQRPYRWGWHRAFGIRMLRFGWPLVLNGLLMFGVFHGDQFIVASYYTMSDLAAFALAGSLATAPSFIFARVFPSLMLPLMARVQGDVIEFRRRYRLVIQVVCAFSAFYGVGLILGGEAVMQAMFGSKYASSGYVLGWLAAANSLRILRMAPAVAALAKADSQNQMLSNLWRVTALVPALAAALTRQSLWMIAATGALGEAIACVISFRRLSHRDAIPWSFSAIPAAAVLLVNGLAATGVLAGLYDLDAHVGIATAIVCAVLCGAGLTALFPDCRTQMNRVLHECGGGKWYLSLPRLFKSSP